MAMTLVDGFVVSIPRGKGGAAIAGLLEAVRSVRENVAAVRSGHLGEDEAVRNVVGDTAIAASGGATGAMVGGWIGSMIPIPVVGTVVGAYLGAEVGGWVAGELHQHLDPLFHVEEH